MRKPGPNVPPEHRQLVANVVRRHDYYSVDAALAEIAEAGVEMSRSALGRYMKRLRESDAALMAPEDQTVVVLVDRKSGATHTFMSGHTAAELAIRIGKKI